MKVVCMAGLGGDPPYNMGGLIDTKSKKYASPYFIKLNKGAKSPVINFIHSGKQGSKIPCLIFIFRIIQVRSKGGLLRMNIEYSESRGMAIPYGLF